MFKREGNKVHFTKIHFTGCERALIDHKNGTIDYLHQVSFIAKNQILLQKLISFGKISQFFTIFSNHVNPLIPLGGHWDTGWSQFYNVGLLQGDSKRLLKVHASITSISYGVGDLKFAQSNFKTIKFDTSGETNLTDINASL